MVVVVVVAAAAAVVVIVLILVIIIIIITTTIALKGAIHEQHIELISCNLQCNTWYEGTAQLLSLTELKSHLF